MGPTLTGLAIGFLVLGVALWPLERLFAALPHQPMLRKGFTTDLAYWAFTPLVTRGLTRAGVVVAVVVLAAAAGVPLDRTHVQAFLASPGALVQRQPMALQVIEVLVLGDLVGYWTHRLFHHQSTLWRFHAVHHGSTELDWLSAVRLHPVNDVVSRVAGVVPVLLLGFSPGILAGYVPFLTLYAIVLHANVTWSFGPLRYVLASPTFHRWHHTSEAEGLDRNFAGLFPVFDLVFGTFYMPPGRGPQRFGLARETVPEGLLAQLAYPFRAQPRGRQGQAAS